MTGGLAALAALSAVTVSGGEARRFEIRVAIDGVYALSFSALREAGLELAAVDSDQLSMTHRGRALPIAVLDGGDGRFEPGDHLEFVGQRLAGERSYYDEHSRLNVYWLEVGAGPGERLGALEPATAAEGPARAWRARQHHEEERLRLRFSPDGSGEVPESWYWARLTHLDPEPYRHTLDLSALRPTAERPATIRVALRGWSKAVEKAPDTADHRVEVLLNGALVGSGEWSHQRPHTIAIDGPFGDRLRAGPNELALRVPRRYREPGGEPLIDVALVNWIEVDFARTPRLGSRQEALEPSPGGQGRLAELLTDSPEPLVIHTAGRRGVTRVDGGSDPGLWRHRFALPREGDPRVYAVPSGALLAPLEVEAAELPDLRGSAQQSDYLIVGHASLLEAIAPLARFHRQRGLTVKVVDVEDVYDAFNHGLPHPRAIRDFVGFARRHWRAPAPRFLLLVGDASWDPGEDPDDARYADWTYRPGEAQRFVKNASTPYADGASRNLVPTWSVPTQQGLAASDGWLADVEGDDRLPDLAVGRLPVATPAEVSAIVDKSIAYSRAGVGSWRRQVLLVSNEEQTMQRRSDRLADELGTRGFTATRVYPSPQEADNLTHQQELRRLLGEGHLLVHFVGHGGRYIWRTGPPSLEKDHDLFTLQDLDALAPATRLPVLLSMTCYSAPFDHPTADSIGEKFLRLDGRGAVAVLAASWRNNPSQAFSRLLLEELSQPATIGEAILRAKHRLHEQRSGRRGSRGRLARRRPPQGFGDLDRVDLEIETYNLLGDPALRVAAPALRLEVDARPEAAGWRLRTAIDHPGFEGLAIVEALDASGEPVSSRQLVATAPGVEWQLKVEPGGVPPASARIYAWDEGAEIDGIGAVALPPPSEVSPVERALDGREAEAR